jgi:hypothetical protein
MLYVGAIMASTKRPRKSTKADREAHKRAKIDADLAKMATDPVYIEQSELIDRQFAYSDWEALQIAEAEYRAKAPSPLLRCR